LISLIAIGSGLMIMFGFLMGRKLNALSSIFLTTLVLTSVTGIGFSFDHLTKRKLWGWKAERNLKKSPGLIERRVKTPTHNIRHVFIMAGASPRTEWLKGCVLLDDKVFILTGRDLDASAGLVPPFAWPLTRPPQLLESSLPGVFAVGDVRSGNVKRVAAGVGEGAISIPLVHRALAEF
jgi:thioredoxin reductase